MKSSSLPASISVSTAIFIVFQFEVIQCEICGIFNFKTVEERDQHVKIVHPGGKRKWNDTTKGGKGGPAKKSKPDPSTDGEVK